MKLVLLGTAGFIPTDHAQTACFMLPEVGVLLDAGTGLYRVNRYLQTSELDIYISHAHGDHTRGLTFLFAAYVVHLIHSSKTAVDQAALKGCVVKANELLHSARIHAAQPALDFLAQEYKPYRMDLRLLNPQEALPGGGTITSFNVGNQDEVGFRLDWPGHSLAYVTDTIAKPDSPYIEHITGVNLLLHECNGPNRLASMMSSIHHSHTSAVAQVAAQAQVGRLILVHSNPIEDWSIAPDLDDARAVFPATDIGVDGMELDF